MNKQKPTSGQPTNYTIRNVNREFGHVKCGWGCGNEATVDEGVFFKMRREGLDYWRKRGWRRIRSRYDGLVFTCPECYPDMRKVTKESWERYRRSGR